MTQEPPFVADFYYRIVDRAIEKQEQVGDHVYYQRFGLERAYRDMLEIAET